MMTSARWHLHDAFTHTTLAPSPRLRSHHACAHTIESKCAANDPGLQCGRPAGCAPSHHRAGDVYSFDAKKSAGGFEWVRRKDTFTSKKGVEPVQGWMMVDGTKLNKPGVGMLLKKKPPKMPPPKPSLTPAAKPAPTPTPAAPATQPPQPKPLAPPPAAAAVPRPTKSFNYAKWDKWIDEEEVSSLS